MPHGTIEKSTNKRIQAKRLAKSYEDELDESVNRKEGGRKEGGTTKRNSSTKKNSGPRPAHA